MAWGVMAWGVMAMNPTTIGQIWQAFGLQPHRAESFELSTDPLCVEKVRDLDRQQSERCQVKSRLLSLVDGQPGRASLFRDRMEMTRGLFGRATRAAGQAVTGATGAL